MYSPNAQGAWESVFYIQNVVAGGWILRGIHHVTAQVMIVLLVLHLMQVLIDGAYRAPREVNFWLGLVLLLLVLGLSLTGYLLPWDQKGYWATKVATSIAAMTPVVGSALQQLVAGGSDYGHATLTRFFALHAGLLPAAVVVVVGAHIFLFRRHGVTVHPSSEDRPDGWFFPDQLLRDSVACLAVAAAILFLVLRTHGADLGAPASAADPYAAARPEWYFLFLFQWLKYFPAGWEVVGAHLIPGLVLAAVAAMPFIGRWELGHRFNLGFALALLLGVSALTWTAQREDAADPGFNAARAEAEQEASRVLELATAPAGIPPSGALTLVRNDPLLQGPKIFAGSCASCHRYQGHDGLGQQPEDPPEASDLAGFGTRAWLSGLLDPDRVATETYFGATEHARGRMVRFVQRGLGSLDGTERERIEKIVIALSAQAALPAQAELDARDAEVIAEGLQLMSEDPTRCTRCHTIGAWTDGDVGPVLTGWASRSWMLGMLHDPEHPDFYGDRNDGMPRFGAEEILDRRSMELVVDWLRGDWYRPDPD
jgi:ubiquinol-cytochrome c reductase cytochrome b subunit